MLASSAMAFYRMRHVFQPVPVCNIRNDEAFSALSCV